MTEGFTISEAASLLGVPTERVWELIARGVFSGELGGDGAYRVHLGGRAPTALTPEQHSNPATRPDGDPEQDEARFEWRAFRELLTEFRTLTERYGQALLALGEARGEVAALRGRVDLLEARIDPTLAHRPAWQLPAPSEPVEAEAPTQTADAGPAVPPVATTEADEGRAAPAVTFAIESEPAAELADGLDAGWAREASPDEATPAAEAGERSGEKAEADQIRHGGGYPGPRQVRRQRLAATLRRQQRPRVGAVAGIPEALARADDPTLDALAGSGGAAEEPRPAAQQAHAAIAIAAEAEPSESPAPAVDEQADLRAQLSASVPDDVDPIEWVERILAPSIARPLPEPPAAEGEASAAPVEPRAEAAEPQEIAEPQAAQRRPQPEPPPPQSAQAFQLPGGEELEVALDALRASPPARAEQPPEPTAPTAPSPGPSARPVSGFDPIEFRRRLMPGGEPGWPRGRRGPAATAYQRLRRLFPG